MNKNIFLELSSIGCKIKQNELLSKHTTLSIGGNASYFVEVSNEQQLVLLLKFISKNKIKFYVIGGGSNLLFSDNGFDGIIIKLVDDFYKYKIEGNNVVCGSAIGLSHLAQQTAQQSLSGLEQISAIPGTVGGAVFGNAGLKDYPISTVIDKVEVIDFLGNKKVLTKDNIKFEYRKSNLHGNILTKIFFVLKNANKNDIVKAVLQEQERRKHSQPIGTKNAGCVFKNPKGNSAGQLIDSLNLKNYSVGDIEISPIHANFFVNKCNGKAEDMLNLIEFVKQAVNKKYNINLETEIQIIK